MKKIILSIDLNEQIQWVIAIILSILIKGSLNPKYVLSLSFEIY